MTTPPTDRVWCRYVAIGDSFTEGLSDPDPDHDDAFVGWADRLAGHLDALADREHLPFGYANLAVRGRTLADVVGPQLDAALAMSPDLVSMVGGGNDLLRPSVDLDGLAARLEEAVVRIRATGADVLLATPTDTRAAGLFKALRGRHAVHSANLFTIAQRHGCAVLNLWGMTALQDWRMWSEDRIHLTTEGHRRVALAALTALGHETDDGDWSAPLPPQARPGRSEALRGHAAWARTHAGPWVERRVRGTSSGDGREPKRPTLEYVRDPDERRTDQTLPDG
ncbi:SGNH/GDSL hydrolase family protein [Phycicoccus sp. BSK3Z-2]|uniref:SGNH/GDSL hydrolase family protein n=1 Tax=Phycicoccus avicenniae TaxID=2828860 RepID=A0A941HYK9_9MICO|nr:SGNH/GDSL hydrolase family protein [Phycicoccus avicenniae]MBR7741965.1 SGNH/GDSL hydrolase family protein [Phycicoccus avicenniae]